MIHVFPALVQKLSHSSLSTNQSINKNIIGNHIWVKIFQSIIKGVKCKNFNENTEKNENSICILYLAC